MNEQRPPNAIEWTRIKNADGTVRRGWTWNPIAGCMHDCEWNIAGERAECYAKKVAEKFTTAYPNGFASYYWHPKRLKEPGAVKEPSGIFPDSMSDLFGHWVKEEHLAAVLQVMRDTPQHIYQSLTKNTKGYNRVFDQLPANLWPGMSSPPDHMWGHAMSDFQRDAYMDVGLQALQYMADRYERTTWMSFEPLSQDWTKVVEQYRGALKWAVIGAASNGNRYYPPDERHVRDLIDVLDSHGVAIFFKGNMRSLPWAAANWREDFPTVQKVVA